MSQTKQSISLVLALAALAASAGIAQATATPAAPAPAAAAPADSAATSQEQGRAAFEANCATCHELSDATSQAKDLAGWTQTIEKMVGYGAAVAAEDQQIIAAYLAATYPAPRS